MRRGALVQCPGGNSRSLPNQTGESVLALFLVVDVAQGTEILNTCREVTDLSSPPERNSRWFARVLPIRLLGAGHGERAAVRDTAAGVGPVYRSNPVPSPVLLSFCDTVSYSGGSSSCMSIQRSNSPNPPKMIRNPSITATTVNRYGAMSSPRATLKMTPRMKSAIAGKSTTTSPAGQGQTYV